MNVPTAPSTSVTHQDRRALVPGVVRGLSVLGFPALPLEGPPLPAPTPSLPNHTPQASISSCIINPFFGSVKYPPCRGCCLSSYSPTPVSASYQASPFLKGSFLPQFQIRDSPCADWEQDPLASLDVNLRTCMWRPEFTGPLIPIVPVTVVFLVN